MSSVSLTSDVTPRSCQIDAFAGSVVPFVVPEAPRGSRLAFDGQAGSPRKMRIHARAHSGSTSTSLPPARFSAAASASSCELAPPSEASGFLNGACVGGPLHQAAQKKRLLFVVVIEQAGAKSSDKARSVSNARETIAAEASVQEEDVTWLARGARKQRLSAHDGERETDIALLEERREELEELLIARRARTSAMDFGRQGNARLTPR